MYKNPKILTLTAFLITLFTANVCGGGEMSQNKTLENVLKNLSGRKIYFGHQSVGNNILGGVGDILKENPQVKLNIVKISEPAALNSPILLHSFIGENENPESKINDFAKMWRRA